MNRITNLPEFQPAQPVRKSESGTGTPGTAGGFQDALKTAMNETSGTPATQAPLGPPRAAILSRELEPATSPVLETRTEGLVHRMEQFSSALMDPTRSLKELAPMADALAQDADSLIRETKSSDQKSDSMQDLAKRSAVLARVEVEKFRRGDYS